MTSESGEMTALIQQWRTGNRAAIDSLIEEAYPELHKIASAYLNGERLDHTLAPAALVNELYLKFIVCPTPVQNRTHFFALAAQTLRHILVDYARLHKAKKRGGNALDDLRCAPRARVDSRREDLLSIRKVLKELQELDTRAARVVELRFFAGLSEEEVARVLGVSKNTVQRDWKTARIWLAGRLRTGCVRRQMRSPAS